MLNKVFSLKKEFHVLIVDDGSPDGTAQFVKNYIQSVPGKLFIEERQGKQGLGTAYIHGFKWALKHNYLYVFEMDADFSHNPDDLERLYNTCSNEGADIAIGSRYCKGGKVKNWPFTRWLMSYFASLYVRIILWMNIKDTTAGFKCYKRIVLEKLDFTQIRFIGYAFQIEMKYTAFKMGFKLKEVPITFVDRQFGQSKMSMKIFKEAFFGVWKMKRKKINKI